MTTFNEQTLRDEIVRVWGPAGAHITVYDELLRLASMGRSPKPPEPTHIHMNAGLVNPVQSLTARHQAVIKESFVKQKPTES